jgi:lipid II:glycine glycyltransferase (peptidoglycan interpeptide bridge formation enzyme)
MPNRDEYVEKMKNQLDQWNAEIAKWEVKSREAQAEARAEYDKRLEALKQQREQAMYQMKLLQAAAGEAWVEMMRGTDEAWARMREAFDKASSHFRVK